MQEPIYKGATRPAMKWGVPLMALIAIFMPTIIVGMWCTVYVTLWTQPVVIATLVPLYLWMRLVTSRDDQRLTQMMLRLRLQRLSRNRRFWKSRTYAAWSGRGARHVWR